MDMYSFVRIELSAENFPDNFRRSVDHITVDMDFDMFRGYVLTRAETMIHFLQLFLIDGDRFEFPIKPKKLFYITAIEKNGGREHHFDVFVRNQPAGGIHMEIVEC